MTAGELITCAVETVAYGGDGIARVDGRVVFIPETAAEETVTARITQVKKNFARAELFDILEASPYRTAPCCRVEDPLTKTACRIPGCVYDHLDYEAEIRFKQQQIEGFLRRFQGAERLFSPAVASPEPLHYRNKIVLHAQREEGRMCLGYRMEPSHRVLDIAACPLACDGINRLLSELRGSAVFGSLDNCPDIIFRHTRHDGAVWLDAARRGKTGPSFLTEDSPAGPLRVPYDGFYQVNPLVSDLLVRTVSEWFAQFPDAPELLDLYCGVGVFGLMCMKAGGTRLTGVESGRSAISAARENARSLQVPARFFSMELGHGLLSLRDHLPAPSRTTIILDPPREGLAASVANALATCGARRILYVSCDPATLSRDLAILLKGGYALSRARMFDMFPRTAHFETLVELYHD